MLQNNIYNKISKYYLPLFKASLTILVLDIRAWSMLRDEDLSVDSCGECRDNNR